MTGRYSLYNTGTSITYIGTTFEENNDVLIFDLTDMVNCKFLIIENLIWYVQDFNKKILEGVIEFRKDNVTKTPQEFYDFMKKDLPSFALQSLNINTKNFIIDEHNNRILMKKSDNTLAYIPFVNVL
jgi:hypothetical protein